jgi:hypothetical protein
VSICGLLSSIFVFSAAKFFFSVFSVLCGFPSFKLVFLCQLKVILKGLLKNDRFFLLSIGNSKFYIENCLDRGYRLGGGSLSGFGSSLLSRFVGCFLSCLGGCFRGWLGGGFGGNLGSGLGGKLGSWLGGWLLGCPLSYSVGWFLGWIRLNSKS